MMAGNGDGRDHSIIADNIRLKTRFGRMLTAVRQNATMEEMKSRFPGYDASTHEVLHAIVKGTISEGKHLSHRSIVNCPERTESKRAEIYAYYDAGLSIESASRAAGIAYGTAKHWRTQWGHERGMSRKRGK